MDRCKNMAGMAALKDGNVIHEGYFNNCNADSRIHVYSVSKSVIATLVGIAIDKGYIEGVHQRILDFFQIISPKEAQSHSRILQ